MPSSHPPVKIFIAYSRKDAVLLAEFRTHLAPLERNGKVKVWSDSNIEPGHEWDTAIKQALYEADIIVLLVSADSIASDYFYGKEVSISLERQGKGEARVVPLILRPCAWEETPLGELQAIPKDGKPVVNWPSHDEGWNNAIAALSAMAGKIKEQKQAVYEANLFAEQKRQAAIREQEQLKASAQQKREAEARRQRERAKKESENIKRGVRTPGPLPAFIKKGLLFLLPIAVAFFLIRNCASGISFVEKAVTVDTLLQKQNVVPPDTKNLSVSESKSRTNAESGKGEKQLIANSPPTAAPVSTDNTEKANNTTTTEDPDVAALHRQQQEDAKRKQEEQDRIAAAEKARKDKIKNSGLGGSSNPFGQSPGSGGGTGGGPGNSSSISSGLDGRKVLKMAKAEYTSNKQGKVRVKICVDSSGDVTSAEYTLSGSTTNDASLRAAAITAARQCKFVAAPAVDTQCGWIEYNFMLK